MIKRLQQLPHENEDQNQNIDDDDLAQVVFQLWYRAEKPPIGEGLGTK
jgi:hypothetical protein